MPPKYSNKFQKLKKASKPSNNDTLDPFTVIIDNAFIHNQLAQEFISLVATSSDEEFPELSNRIDCLNDAINIQQKDSKLVLLLVDLDKEALVYLRKHPTISSCATISSKLSDRIDDALNYLIYSHHVGVSKVKSISDAVEYLVTLTRVVQQKCGRPQFERLDEDYLTKVSVRKQEKTSNVPDKTFQMQETYIRMLVAVPLLGEKKARCLASHYPSPQALHSALTDPSVPLLTRQTLLEDKFDPKTKYTKLAKHVYNVWTSHDPAANISDDFIP